MPCQLLNSLAEEEKYVQKSFARRPSLPALRSLSSEQRGHGGASARDRARSSMENKTARAYAEKRPPYGGSSARESARVNKPMQRTETTSPGRRMPANDMKPPGEKVQRCHLDVT